MELPNGHLPFRRTSAAGSMVAPHFHDHRLSHTFFFPFSLHFTSLASPSSLHAVHRVRSPLRSPLARPLAARTRTCAPLTRSLFPSLPPEKEREREREKETILLHSPPPYSRHTLRTRTLAQSYPVHRRPSRNLLLRRLRGR